MTVPVNSVKQEVLRVLSNSEEMLHHFRSQIENKSVIVFLGNTRSGKSTLINYVAGTPLVSFRDEDVFRIGHQNGLETNTDIGHGTLSHTTEPSVIRMRGNSDLVMVDAPGFDDNRGVVQEIINSLYVNQIKYAKRVRFVLVTDMNSIISDNINSFIAFLETVHTIMPNFDKLKEAVSIIFTKDSRGYDCVEVVQLLKSKILEEKNLKCRKDLIAHFVKRQNLIGLFKMPLAVGALSEEINVNIHGAVFDSFPLNLVETDIKFGISNSAKVVLLETYLDFFNVVVFLKEEFQGFSSHVLGKLCNLNKDKLLAFHNEQLSGKDSAKSVVNQFWELVKFDLEQIRSPMQIPNSLQKVFIDDANKALILIQGLGIEVPQYQDSKFNEHTIEEVNKRLEYIESIEKVVERDDKSKNILMCYQENARAFCFALEKLSNNIEKEMEFRTFLLNKLPRIPDINYQFSEMDESYLTASSINELKSMKFHLQRYRECSVNIIENIHKRPSLNERCTRNMHKVTLTHRSIENVLLSIERYLDSRRQDASSFNILMPAGGLVGSLTIFAGCKLISNLQWHAQVSIMTGSFVLLAILSSRSRYVRRVYHRMLLRHQQKRLLSSRTILDDCWKKLSYDDN